MWRRSLALTKYAKSGQTVNVFQRLLQDGQLQAWCPAVSQVSVVNQRSLHATTAERQLSSIHAGAAGRYYTTEKGQPGASEHEQGTDFVETGDAFQEERPAGQAAHADAEAETPAPLEGMQQSPSEDATSAGLRAAPEPDPAAERIKELEDRIKYVLADMENLRQRTARQSEQARQFALQGFVKGLLDVADNLERASGQVSDQQVAGKNAQGEPLNAEQTLTLLQSLLEGVRMTEKILHQVLGQHGVQRYVPVNEPFDPNVHEALFELEDPGMEPRTVKIVTKSGYKLNDRVVRPAQVGVVASR